MPLIKCSKCREEYDSLSIHTCEKEEAEKKEAERNKWENATGIKKIFMYHPDASWLTRVIAFVWFIPAATGLLAGTVFLIGTLYSLIIGDFSWVGGEARNVPAYIYIAVVAISAMFLSYGISHLKRWSLYLYGALLLFIFLITGYILFGLMGILGFILILVDYKKFH